MKGRNRSITCYNGWRNGLEVRSWRKDWKYVAFENNSWKFFRVSKTWNDKSVPNKRLNYLYLIHKTFQRSHRYNLVHSFAYNSPLNWKIHGPDQTSSSIQELWLMEVAPQTSGCDQRLWWHLRNTNQEHSPGIRYSSTIIAFICVTRKSKVMSPQSFPRDVGINCGMTIDQASWRGNISIWLEAKWASVWQTQTIQLLNLSGHGQTYWVNSERVPTRACLILMIVQAIQDKRFTKSKAFPYVTSAQPLLWRRTCKVISLEPTVPITGSRGSVNTWRQVMNIWQVNQIQSK
jgi:hypothetical protein